MRKTAKRTDLAIIIILAIIALLIFFSAKTGKDSPAGEPEEVTLESFKGRPLGAQPGSPSEAVISERFPDSQISYYTGFPEYILLSSPGKLTVLSQARWRCGRWRKAIRM